MASATKSRSKRKSARNAPKRSAQQSRSRHIFRRNPGRVRDALNEQLGAHRTDLGAVVFGVAGVLAALGVLSSAAGPFGEAIDSGVGALLGEGRFLLPFACWAAAASLVWRRSDADQARLGVRVGVGLAFVLFAVVGLLHIARSEATDAFLDASRDAGGFVGALTGGPLSSLAGVAGASVVLVAIAAAGLLLVCDLRIHQVASGAVVAARWVASQVHGLVELRVAEEEPDDSENESPAPRRAKRAPKLVVFDQFGDPGQEVDLATFDTPVNDIDIQQVSVDAEPQIAVIDIAELEADEVSTTGTQLALAMPPGARTSDWKLPAASVLKRGSAKQIDQRFVDLGGEVLEATMREFGVDARLVGASVGPTVTRYELELAPGVKVNKVTGLAKEIAYAMASHDVRILAPIPGRSAIGVEVPNKQRPIITLGDILASDEAKSAKHPLDVGMGRDIAGKAHMANLSTFPHVLIAGQTGAGKSSCINSIVTSILMRATPDLVRLILIDPKRVELGQYNGVPHLLTEVVTNPKKAANALDWAVREMELRYDLLSEVGVRDIAGYNARYDRGDLPTAENPDPHGGRNYERLPFIVIVVDELADLMMVAARDVETSICRLAQMARAVGLHLVIATQRPSVDVITGVIKANVPSRLAFAVSSLADSRVILDQQGAEKLVGKGDMLLLAASTSRTERIQGSWVDEDCVRKVVAHWRRQVETPQYIEGVQGNADSTGGSDGYSSSDDDGDDLLAEAMELVVRSGLGSTSMLQRKLRVGFARAGRIMDLLERKGIVGPSEGSKARSVLMTVDELEALLAKS